MGKLTAVATPDLSADDRKWLESRPRLRMFLIVVRIVLVPIVLYAIAKGFDYQLKKESRKSNAGYAVTREVVDELQGQVKVLAAKVDVILQVLPRSGATTTVTLPAVTSGARSRRLQPPVTLTVPDVSKKPVRVSAPIEQHQLPSDLDQALEQSAQKK